MAAKARVLIGPIPGGCGGGADRTCLVDHRRTWPRSRHAGPARGRVLYGVDASFMQVEVVHGWDIHAVSAPGRRAPPATPGRVVRWRITAAAPRGRPGRAAARPDDTNAASTGRAPRQPLAKIYGTGLSRAARAW